MQNLPGKGEGSGRFFRAGVTASGLVFASSQPGSFLQDKGSLFQGWGRFF